MKYDKLAKFVNLTTKEKLMFFEAMILLFFSKLVVWFVPFRKVAPYLGRINGDYRKRLTEQEIFSTRQVKLFISMVSGNAAINSVCLDQAMAGMIMLRNRKIPSSIHLGVKRNEVEKKMDAHAWIVCGDEILIGGQRSKQYVQVAFFSIDY